MFFSFHTTPLIPPSIAEHARRANPTERSPSDHRAMSAERSLSIHRAIFQVCLIIPRKHPKNWFPNVDLPSAGWEIPQIVHSGRCKTHKKWDMFQKCLVVARRALGGRSAGFARGPQGCPQAIAHSDCAIYSNKVRYLLFQNYCRITVI